MIRVAINGYGRIGRSILRALYESGKRQQIQIVAINELAKPEAIIHLTQYDTTHGRFAHKVKLADDHMLIGDDAIKILHEADPAKLPWREMDIDIVYEATGAILDRQSCEAHIHAGAKRVLISHPSSADVDGTIVYGVNHDLLRAEHTVVSNASCTTNCIVPVIDVLDKHFGVKSGAITTIHSAMNDQQVIDAYHDDLRRTRAAGQSIIPVDTKLARGIERILPHMKDKFEAISVRVPTITAAPLARANSIVGREARRRASLVTAPLLTGTLRSSRISTRLPWRSKSDILIIAMVTLPFIIKKQTGFSSIG